MSGIFTVPIWGSNGEAYLVDDDYIFVTGGSATTYYYHVDLNNKTKTLLDSFSTPYNTNPSCPTDGTFLFMPTSTTNIGQYKWDGANIVQVLDAADGSSSNPSKGMAVLSGFGNRVLTCATEAFGHGLRCVEYVTAPTFSYPTKITRTPANDAWCALMDFRYGNPATAAFGDALVMAPENGDDLVSYEIVGGTNPTQRDALSATSLGNTHAWGWNRDAGTIATHFSGSASVGLYQVSMSDLSLSSIGTGITEDQVRAVGFSPDDIVVTVEDTGGAQDAIRTYSRSGATLTQEDSLALSGTASSNSCIYTSPYTGRVYVFCQGSDSLVIIDVAPNGVITLNQKIAVGSPPGSFGHSIGFAAAALPTT